MTRFLVAVVLLFAVYTKANSLISPALSEVVGNAVQTTLIASMELVLIAWIVSGWRKRTCSKVLLFTFFAFTIHSSYLIFKGQASCNCFGYIQTSPMFTGLLSSFLACCLLASLAFHQDVERQPLKQYIGGSVAVLVLLFAMMLNVANSNEMNVSRLPQDRNYVFFDPSDRIGKQIPKFRNFDFKPLYLEDSYVLLSRDSCETCRSVLEQIQNYKELIPDTHLLVVEFRDNKDASKGKSYRNSDLERYTVKDEKHWICQTPVWMRIRKNTIIEVSKDMYFPLVSHTQ